MNAVRDRTFERAGVDDVFLIGQDVGALVQLQIDNDGSGDSPRWYVEAVEVFKGAEPAVTFGGSSWVNAGASVVLLPQP